MTNKEAYQEIVARRAELLAELFLEELEPAFVAKATDEVGYDFLLGLPNARGGVNNYAVEVKATASPVAPQFGVSTRMYERLAHSNIPALLLVVDVKSNRLYYAWLTAELTDVRREGECVEVALTEVTDEAKSELRKQLAA